MTDFQEMDNLISLSKNEGFLIIEFHTSCLQKVNIYHAEFLGKN